jgi:hypothetical protein
MIHLFTMLIDKNQCNFVLVEFRLLWLIQKLNQNCRLTRGPVFLLGGCTLVSVIRKLNFEKKNKELKISISVN